MNLSLNFKKVKFVLILSILLILISPIISIALTPLTQIPAIILAAILTRSECASIRGESLCGFGTLIFLTYFFNIILCILLISFIFFILHKNQSLIFKLVLVTFLAVYQISLTLIFFRISNTQQENISKQREEVFITTLNTQLSDLKIIEKTRNYDLVNTVKYFDSIYNYVLYYPDNFKIEEHQKPENLYFRPLTNKGITRNTIATTGVNGNEFFSIQNINFNYSQFSSEEEALSYVLNEIKTNIKNEKNFPVRLSKTVETSTTIKGWKIFFLEDSHGQDNQKVQFFNELSIIIKTPKGYLLWDGYSSFIEGNKFIKDTIITIE